VHSLYLGEMDHVIRAIYTVLHLVMAGFQGQVPDLGIFTQHYFTLLADFDDLLIRRGGDSDAE
jgi:hypothetical protein